MLAHFPENGSLTLKLCGKKVQWKSPLVYAKVGIIFHKLVSDALDAILNRGNYSLAFDLNARLTDAVSDAAAFLILLDFIEIYIE